MTKIIINDYDEILPYTNIKLIVYGIKTLPENFHTYIKVGIFIYYKTFGNDYGAYLYEPTAFSMPTLPTAFTNPGWD